MGRDTEVCAKCFDRGWFKYQNKAGQRYCDECWEGLRLYWELAPPKGVVSKELGDLLLKRFPQMEGEFGSAGRDMMIKYLEGLEDFGQLIVKAGWGMEGSWVKMLENIKILKADLKNLKSISFELR